MSAGNPGERTKRLHLSTSLDTLQIGWDSTSLGDLKTCPRKYYLSQILCLRPKRTATPLAFGIMFHSAMEAYHKAKAKGADHEEGVRAALRCALEQSGERKLMCSCGYDGPLFHKDADGNIPAQDSTGTITCPSCLKTSADEGGPKDTFIPWASDDPKRNRKTLIEAICAYFDHFREDAAKTVILNDGRAAVELSFRMPTPYTSCTGETYMLCGHMDRVVEFAGQTFVADYKTSTGTLTGHYFQRYSPDNQISLYTIASKVVFEQPAAGVVIDAAQIGVRVPQFQRGIVTRTRAQCEEWLEDLGYWFKVAEFYAQTGVWPQNDKACHHYAGCQFRDICNKDPAVRESYMHTDFMYVEWNPFNSRGGE